MNYWFIFWGNNEYIRRCYNADYLIVKAKNQRKTQKFLKDIADMLGIRDIHPDAVNLLDQFVLNERGISYIIRGKAVYMVVPKDSVAIVTL